VPRDLETVALKCLEREPRRRYGSAQELADDLDRWQNYKPILARPARTYELIWRLVRRYPVAAALATLSALILTLLLVTLAVSNQRITYALAQEREARTDLSNALFREKQHLYFERIGSANRLWNSNQTERAEELLDLCPAEFRRWEWHYLNRLRRCDCVKLDLHLVEVFSIARSADGRRFATADANGGVRLWDAENRTTIQTWDLKELVWRLAFSPDGAHLAAAQSAVVTVLPTAGGEGRRFNGERWVSFSPEGSRLAVVHNDSTVIYDWPSGRRLHELIGHTKTVLTCAFHPNSDRLATSSADSTVRFWDVRSGKSLGEPRTFPQLVHSLRYFSDGRLLVSQHNDSRILDSESGDELTRLPGGSHGADRIAISPDDQLVAWPARDGTIKVWKLKTNEEEFAFRGHPPYIGGLVFGRDSRRLYSVGHDATIRIWGLTPPLDSRLLCRERAVGGISFTSDGRKLAIALATAGGHASETGRVQIVDVASGQELLRLDALGTPRFSHDDRWLATNREDGSVSLWDPVSGREIRKLSAEAHRSMRIAISPDCNRLASGGSAGKILVWDLTGDHPPQVLSGHTDVISSLAFSSDGRLLASSDRHGQISLWDQQGKEINRSKVEHSVHVVAFSPDARRLAIVGESSTINIWNVETCEVLHKLHGHTDWISGVAFTPDGSRVISGSADQTVRLWDVASGQEVLSLTGTRGPVGQVAIDPTGRRLVASEAGVRLWEID
jgi:WD40 repeat protein